MQLYTVTELAEYVKEALERDPHLRNVWVTGEVSNCTRSGAGHCYFTIKDASAAFRAVLFRGNNGDENDNNAIIAEILKLRDERVGLLGYDNYAQWRLEDRMAKTPENALALLRAVLPAALARVDEEIADMQAIADERGDGIEIEAWDYRYYAELVRRDRYALDSDPVKQYLQLDKLRDAMYFVAVELFDFVFKPVQEGSVPVIHPEVKVCEVPDRTSGEHVGLWYLDPFARPGKRSGAWASAHRCTASV